MDKTRRLARGALLTALALGLSYMERFIPLQLLIPLPGIKLGLANVVTLFAVYFLGSRAALQILCVRCLLGSLFGGGVTAFFFSITGGLLALAAMVLARRLPFLSIYGVSVCGAAAPPGCSSAWAATSAPPAPSRKAASPGWWASRTPPPRKNISTRSM